MNLLHLDPFATKGLIRVVIETPKGSRNKLDFDPETKTFHLKKTLPEGMVFPYDFGFIPQTEGQDGDPLDALVLMPESIETGCTIDCRLVGVIRAKQKEKQEKAIRNDRFILVSETASEFAQVKNPSDLPEAMAIQLEEFFVNYNKLEGRLFKLEGIEGPRFALKLIKAARKKT